MGFYGTNLSTANRVAFQFDKVYRSRLKMDNAAQTDGVANNRYVLVEYSEPPITGYFDGTDFYTSAYFQAASRITPRVDVIYQDLVSIGTSYSFYVWNGSRYVNVDSATATTYTANYAEDVRQYGRSYDSTAWMKSYDGATDSWRYVLIAEMNTIVPTFHLAVDAPEYTTTAPYFDRDSTNIDYYLHVQASWGDKIATVTDSTTQRSDETIMQRDVTWVEDAHGQSYNIGPMTTQPARIYYNKAGFSKTTHAKAPSNIVNGINFEATASGRKYYSGVNHSGVYLNGTVADDLRNWYINLPALGDAVCDMYDMMYGWEESDQQRYVKMATQRSDPDARVTYKPNCMIGGLNAIRDMLGYIAIERNKSVYYEGCFTYDSTVAKKIYYDLGDGSTGNSTQPAVYWFFKPYPLYTQCTFNYNPNGISTVSYQTGEGQTVVADIDTSTSVQWSPLYYYNSTRNAYCRVNLDVYQSNQSQQFYYAIPRWTLERIETGYEDSFYGLMLQYNTLMGHELVRGGNTIKLRDDTVWGVMHQIWDLIEDIGIIQQEKNRLLISNPVSGWITTAEAEILPSNSSKVITGAGTLAYPANMSLNGYVKADAASAIAASDSIRVGIGKLEYKVDDTISTVEVLSGALGDEVTARTTADSGLSGRITDIVKDDGTISQRINETRMNLASEALANWISVDGGSITSEVNPAESVSVAALQAAIDARIRAVLIEEGLITE